MSWSEVALSTNFTTLPLSHRASEKRSIAKVRPKGGTETFPSGCIPNHEVANTV